VNKLNIVYVYFMFFFLILGQLLPCSVSISVCIAILSRVNDGDEIGPQKKRK